METEDESSSGPVSISFNQDASCASIGTRSGFYIYNLVPGLEVQFRFVIHNIAECNAPCDDYLNITYVCVCFLLQQRLASSGEGMRIVEMLYVTSLLAVVGSGDTAK